MTSVLKVDNIQNSSGTSALGIDSNGVVTKPVLPAFNLQGTSSSNKDVADGEILGATDDGQAAFTTSGNGAFIQGGMSYNSANGEITVPVAGIYYVGGTLYMNESNAAQVGIYVNGAIRARVHNGATVTKSMEINIVLDLAANDKVTFRNASGAARNFYEGATHTYVFGYLLG